VAEDVPLDPGMAEDVPLDPASAEDIPLDPGMAQDIPLDVALSSVLAAAIDHGDRQALLMVLHRRPSMDAPEEPAAPEPRQETTPAPEPAGSARRLAAVPAPRPDPGPDGGAHGGAVVLAFTLRRAWEPEDPPPAA
jgi:hypothetical protein